jgi:hypothetical protein
MKKGKVKKFMKDNCIAIGGLVIAVLGCGVYKIHIDKKTAALMSEIKKDVRFGVVRDLLISTNEAKGLAWEFNRPWKISDLGKVGESMLAECPDKSVTLDSDLGAIIFTIKK